MYVYMIARFAITIGMSSGHACSFIPKLEVPTSSYHPNVTPHTQLCVLDLSAPNAEYCMFQIDDSEHSRSKVHCQLRKTFVTDEELRS